MRDLLIALIVMVVLAAGAAGYLYYRRRIPRKAVDDILFDVNPLAEWTYSAPEWQRAVENDLSWGKVDDGETTVRICRTGAYFKNKSREHLIPLTNGTRVVTFAGYLGGEGMPLKLRTRWRVITHDQNGDEQIHYYKEDFRIPVPPSQQAAAENVVNYFTKWLDDNMRFYTMMLPDDEPISLFGKDSF